MKPYRQHLSSSVELVTKLPAVRAGFKTMAVERSRRATDFVTQGKVLRAQIAKVDSPAALAGIASVQAALLTAAGVSDKAAGWFQPEDKDDAVKALITDHLEPAGQTFVDEVVYRFLLTRGDTLGGSMRNVAGKLAEQKLARYVMATLRNAGTPYRWLHATNDTWADPTPDDVAVEQHLKGLSWQSNGRHRTLVFNIKVPTVRKNIDLVLLEVESKHYSGSALRNLDNYVAMGELKGGIDPAGADEHWKTATKALSRIRAAFGKDNRNPFLCYVGAAITDDMANEIWEDLEADQLINAANLTDDNQLVSLCGWLCSL